ncbi:Ohr subfamily peroxiredoxin [Kushneria sinocarnis]|uniref:Ohr subfamily peroxiredoxin n=1 Tax=Kushneria sinocarnis TaxID=595502 RepID=A0A420WT38_9GAMM|nr:Ohr family peroxiredoxin [Kushneria sinocarnis]RKQ95784.1 Ohr subfamily peroxiredoxin [Kushneria sinocarnis]
MSVMYQTSVAVSGGGRNGHARSDDGILDVDLAMPGSGESATNPEQLFAAGYAACFASAAKALAKQQGHELEDIPVTAEVALHSENHDYSLGVKLIAEVALPQADAEALIRQAHEMCPYSKATRGNLEVELEVRGQ